MGSAAPERAPWSAVEIPQIPAAGMPGDELFTRGQMCLSLLQTSRPPARPRRRRPRVRALPTPAHRGAGARSPRPSRVPQTAGGAPPALARVRAPLCWPRSRQACAKSGPSPRPRAAPSSNYAPWDGAGGTGRALEVRPPPAEPCTPVLPATPPAPPWTLCSPPVSQPHSVLLPRQTASKEWKYSLKTCRLPEPTAQERRADTSAPTPSITRCPSQHHTRIPTPQPQKKPQKCKPKQFLWEAIALLEKHCF